MLHRSSSLYPQSASPLGQPSQRPMIGQVQDGNRSTAAQALSSHQAAAFLGRG